MINAQIRQFRDSIIALANASALPIEVKRLVFSEIQIAINQESDKIISEERSEQKNQEYSEVNDNE